MCLDTNVCGNKRTRTFVPRHICVQTWLWPHDYNISGHKRVRVQTFLGTNVCGHKRVWAQTCMGTNMCGHNRVRAQTCVGKNVSRHKRVWAQSCEHVWAQTCGLRGNGIFLQWWLLSQFFDWWRDRSSKPQINLGSKWSSQAAVSYVMTKFFFFWHFLLKVQGALSPSP